MAEELEEINHSIKQMKEDGTLSNMINHLRNHYIYPKLLRVSLIPYFHNKSLSIE